MWRIRGAIRPLFRRHSAVVGARRPVRSSEPNIWSKRAAARYTHRPVAAPPVVADPLAPFSPAVRDWFRASFEAPTDAQARGWAAIAGGQHTLIHAPTGSGKTLAAFLWCLDRLATHPRAGPDPRGARRRPRPVRLATQGADLRHRAQPPRPADRDRPGGRASRHRTARTSSVASRTGDTPADDRRQIARHPPDILITTPESLYLMLTSAARDVLRERRGT